jgi:glycerophosphoryl diester phosphodiesterase
MNFGRAACLLAGLLSLHAAAFDVQGHRGARGLLPENTLPAFQKALDLGVTTIECDMAVTKDRVVVIYHDLTLNPDITRGPDGKFLEARGPAISALTFDELQRYDVGRIKQGTEYAKQFPDQAGLDGVRIPRLSDLFDLVKKSGNEKVEFDCETKVDPYQRALTIDVHEFTRLAIAEIRRAGMASRTMVQSFDWSTLQQIQKEAPEIRTMYLYSPRSGNPRNGQPALWVAGFHPSEHGGSIPRAVKAAGGKIFAPNHALLDAAMLAEAKSLGLTVIPWTVNDVPTINKLLEMRVDGIISDRPDLVIQERAKRK